MLLIAIGANLPGPGGAPPLDTCKRALAALQGLDGIDFVAVSRWYRTRPVPADDRQPDYCNGAARFAGHPDPEWLLAALHRIEAGFGRTRGVANAARNLDLDLIACDGMIRHEEPPLLPHPRMHQRAFVLRPVLDIAPDWVHPALGMSAAALLKALPDATAASLVPW